MNDHKFGVIVSFGVLSIILVAETLTNQFEGWYERPSFIFAVGIVGFAGTYSLIKLIKEKKEVVEN